MIRTALALTLLAASAPAQVPIQTDPHASWGGTSDQVLARDGAGILYCVAVLETAAGDRELRVHRSTDGGATWTTDTTVVNDAASGLHAPYPANACAAVIDSTGLLHVSWGAYHYPSNYAQWYRSYDPATGSLGALVDVSGITGAAPTSRTSAMNLAVDGGDTLWLVAHGATSWVERLLRSAQPGAAGGTFLDLGDVSPSSSAQKTQLAVDSAGRVHCSFYRNVSPGNYEHRVYDPSGGWGATTVLGNTSPTNDYFGRLCADSLGNVHAVIAKDVHSSSSKWSFVYRGWDAVSGWSGETIVFEATSAQFTGVASYQIVGLGCDELSGDVSVAYRDLSAAGELVVARKGLADAAFSQVAQLAPPSSGLHQYGYPTIRGSLHPTSNHAGSALDVAWRDAGPGGPPYQVTYAGVSPAGDLYGSPGQVSIANGGVQKLHLDAGPSQAGVTYLLLGSELGTTPGVPIDGVLLNLNIGPYTLHTLSNPNQPPLTGSFGALDSTGRATATFTLPPATLSPAFVGAMLHHAYILFQFSSTASIVYGSQAAEVLLGA